MVEGHSNVGARGSRCGLLGGCGRVGTAALGAARHPAGRAANSAHHPAFQRQHGAAAQRYQQPAIFDEALQLSETIPSDAAGNVIRFCGRAEAWRLRRSFLKGIGPQALGNP